MRSSFFPWTVAAMVGISPLASACALLAPSPAHDAQTACERKKDGSQCFLAGNLISEQAGEMTPEAIRLYTRGCAARNSSSCEMLASVKGPLREQALVDACNGGDLMSCNRRASEFPKDERGLGEARALRHSACKQSVNVKPGMSAREIEGIAESCAGLAHMIAAGEGGARDAVAASKLDVLVATLRAEALYQHEREDDAKLLPKPAQIAAAPPPRRGGVKREPKPDPTVAEREKFRREYEARRAAREAWMSSIDADFLAMQKKASRGDPTLPSLTALERATTTPGSPAGASRCQGCVDSCGTMAQCTGDDFVGGHCGQLRSTDNSAFDTCVAECAAKVDTCTKACGECTEPAPAKGGK